MSQSAFVRGFIDDAAVPVDEARRLPCLNPRSCAASSMTGKMKAPEHYYEVSQSAFVRGFIDDGVRRTRFSWTRIRGETDVQGDDRDEKAA